MDNEEWNGPGGITFSTGDNKLMVWGWVAVVLAVAVGVAVWQLSMAISAGILILSGCGGLSMLILTGAKAYAGIMLTRAQAKRLCLEGKARVIEARGYRMLEGGKDGQGK